MSYRTYTNAKYAYAVDVASLFTNGVSYGSPGAGQQWTWGSKAVMNVTAGDAGGKTSKEWFEAAKKEPGYMGGAATGSWFWKTGKRSGKIFWQKSALWGAGMLYTVRLEYDEDQKVFFDPIVSRVSRSFHSL
jgi:hypothetical protein